MEAVALFGISLWFFFALAMITLAVASFVFWLWMLIDCASNEPAQGNDKALWLIILIVTFVFGVGLIGALIYYFARRPDRIRLYGV